MVVKPVVWMRAVRDHTPKPPANSARFSVLWGLALRMDSTGQGFASARQIADDVVLHERTVRRHLTWASEAGYLIRTRRGHRLGSGQAVASEYQLSQPDTGVRLSDTSTGQTADLNRTATRPQPDTGARPRGLSSRGLPQAARADTCHHWDFGRDRSRVTADGDCLSCHAASLCPHCARLSRHGPVVPCNEHREAG